MEHLVIWRPRKFGIELCVPLLECLPPKTFRTLIFRKESEEEGNTTGRCTGGILAKRTKVLTAPLAAARKASGGLATSEIRRCFQRLLTDG